MVGENLTVATLFGLSLLAAVILFRFFKSSALVKTTKYRAGGAFGGFLLVYLLLQFSHDRISDNQLRKSNEQLTHQINELTAQRDATVTERDDLRRRFQHKQVSGKVRPPAAFTLVALAVAEGNADSNGNFKISASCLDPETSGLTVFAVRQSSISFRLVSSLEEYIEINFP